MLHALPRKTLCFQWLLFVIGNYMNADATWFAHCPNLKMRGCADLELSLMTSFDAISSIATLSASRASNRYPYRSKVCVIDECPIIVWIRFGPKPCAIHSAAQAWRSACSEYLASGMPSFMTTTPAADPNWPEDARQKDCHGFRPDRHRLGNTRSSWPFWTGEPAFSVFEQERAGRDRARTGFRFWRPKPVLRLVRLGGGHGSLRRLRSTSPHKQTAKFGSA